MEKSRGNSVIISLISELLITSIFIIIVSLQPSLTITQTILGFSRNRFVILGILLFFLIVLTILIVRYLKNDRFSPKFDKLFLSTAFSSGLLFLVTVTFSVFLFSFIPLVFKNQLLMSRLRPIVIYLFLSGLSLLAIQWLNSKKSIKRYISLQIASALSLLDSLLTLRKLLIFTLCAALPLLFNSAMKYQYPSGYAGLFVLMSESIKNNGFQLPLHIPFYGPGGIPFAYPPLGPYVMAFFTSIIRISNWDYLRFFPPLIMFLSIIPIYFIGYEITKSRFGSLFTATLIMTSVVIFEMQGTSGGIVRGLAYLFTMFAIISFLLATRRNLIILALVSGVCIGLSGLTHLLYAQFATLFVVIYSLFQLSRRVWRHALTAGGSAILVIIPWFILTLNRFGFPVLENAFDSHGNNYFLTYLTNTENIIKISQVSIGTIAANPFFLGLLLLGLTFTIVGRKAWLAVWFFASLLLLGDNARFLATIGAFLSAEIAAVLFKHLKNDGKKFDMKDALNYQSLIFGALLVFVLYIYGWDDLSSRNQPVISKNTLAVGEFIKNSTTLDTKYLVLAGPQEAEWFPLLLHRTPIVGSWGGEWIGTFAKQASYVSKAVECDIKQSYGCIIDLITSIHDKPKIIITHLSSDILNGQIDESNCWVNIYENQEYIVWRGINKQTCTP